MKNGNFFAHTDVDAYGILYSLALYLVEIVKIEILYVGSVGELQDSSLRAQILGEGTFVCACIYIFIYF